MSVLTRSDRHFGTGTAAVCGSTAGIVRSAREAGDNFAVTASQAFRPDGRTPAQGRGVGRIGQD